MKYEYFIKYPSRGSLYEKKAFVRVFSILEDHTAAGKKKSFYLFVFSLWEIFFNLSVTVKFTGTIVYIRSMHSLQILAVSKC